MSSRHSKLEKALDVATDFEQNSASGNSGALAIQVRSLAPEDVTKEIIEILESHGFSLTGLKPEEGHADRQRAYLNAPIAEFRRKHGLVDLDFDDPRDAHQASEIETAKTRLPRTKEQIAAALEIIEEGKAKKPTVGAGEALRIDILEKQLVRELQDLRAQENHDQQVLDKEPGFIVKQQRKRLVRDLLRRFAEGKDVPKCQRCGESDEVTLAPGVRQPTFRSVGAEVGWTSPEAPMFLELLCRRCHLLWSAEIGEIESKGKRGVRNE